MFDIGIIGAMDVEVNGLVSRLENKNSEIVSGITFYSGELLGKRVVIAKCGIGKVFAATCAESMIIKYSPRLIINSGVGGALAKDLSTGDIVIADKLCQYDMDTSPIEPRLFFLTPQRNFLSMQGLALSQPAIASLLQRS